MEELKKCAKIIINGTKDMVKDIFVKHNFKKQLANILTFSRLLLAPIVLILMIVGLPLPAFITAIIAGATDFFDGKAAKKYNSTSRYGQLLDQVVDKFFAGIIGIGIALYNPLFWVNIIGEVGIALTSTIIQSRNKDLKMKSTMLARIKQWPLFVGLALGFISAINPILQHITNIMIGIAAAFQVGTIVDYSRIDIKNRKHNNKIIEVEEINDEIDKKEEYQKLKEQILKCKTFDEIKELLVNFDDKDLIIQDTISTIENKTTEDKLKLLYELKEYLTKEELNNKNKEKVKSI